MERKNDPAIANELLITRVFNAPRKEVFKAFTNREALAAWWGPKAFKTRVITATFEPGGIFHYCMEGEDGKNMWGKFVFREINAPEQLVFVNSFSDEEGNIVRAPFGMMIPLEILHIFTFTETEGKTLLTMKATPINAGAEELQVYADLMPSMQEGYGSSFDELEKYLG